MGRDWVKLHTCVWEDEDFAALSNESLGIWTRLLAFAGATDDNGRTRTAKRLAHVLHQPQEIIDRAVVELAGRIVVDPDGVLRFRDWHDWQPLSPAERVRLHRDRKAGEGADDEGSLQRNVTECNDQKRGDMEIVTSPHAGTLDTRATQKVDATTDSETTEGTASAVAAPAAATEPDEPAPPKREPLGPGAKLFKALTHASPNIEQRSLLDAAYGSHGPEKFEAVIREWLRLGYRKQNADGMVNVMERGWTKRPPTNGRGALSNGHTASPDEAAAIDQVIAEGMADVAARLEAPALAPADGDRLWRDVHAGLALRMPAATLKAWVDPVQVASFDGETLTLLAPTTAVHSWLTHRLARELDEALADVAPGARVVVLAPEAAVEGRAA